MLNIISDTFAVVVGAVLGFGVGAIVIFVLIVGAAILLGNLIKQGDER